MQKNKHRGAALLMALLIVAVVAVIAGELLSREHFTINRTINLNNDIKMQAATTIAQNWAAEKLKIPQYKSIFPLAMKTASVGNMQVSASLIDLQGRFNVNNLSDGSQQAYFTKLLQTVDSSVTTSAAARIAKAISVWEEPAGRELVFDKIYAKAHPPYQAAHQLMVSVSELRLVNGVSASIYKNLVAYTAALPEKKTSVNVNTASVPVLLTIANKMSVDTAQQIIQARRNNPFKSIGDFKKFPPIKQLKINTVLTTQSSYFLLITRITLGTQQLYLHTLLQRKVTHGSVLVKPLWQVRNLG